MEARWIRNENEAGLAQQSSQKLNGHLKGYDRIVMLRAFYLKTGQVKYDLVEISHALLLLAAQVEVQNIVLSRGNSGGGSTVIRQNGQAVFTIKFDGSVEKITIANLLVDQCTTHATWYIPLTMPRLQVE